MGRKSALSDRRKTILSVVVEDELHSDLGPARCVRGSGKLIHLPHWHLGIGSDANIKIIFRRPVVEVLRAMGVGAALRRSICVDIQ